MSCWFGVFKTVFFLRSVPFLEVALATEDGREPLLGVLSERGVFCDARPLDVDVPDPDALDIDVPDPPDVRETTDIVDVVDVSPAGS